MLSILGYIHHSHHLHCHHGHGSTHGFIIANLAILIFCLPGFIYWLVKSIKDREFFFLDHNIYVFLSTSMFIVIGVLNILILLALGLDKLIS